MSPPGGRRGTGPLPVRAGPAGPAGPGGPAELGVALGRADRRGRRVAAMGVGAAQPVLPAAVGDPGPDVPPVVLRPGRARVPDRGRDGEPAAQHWADAGRAWPSPPLSGYRSASRSAGPRPYRGTWSRCCSSPGRSRWSRWPRCSSSCSRSARRWKWRRSRSARSGRSCSTRSTGPLGGPGAAGDGPGVPAVPAAAADLADRPVRDAEDFTGFRLSLSLALILMVFAELVGSSNGIGYEMCNATELLRHDRAVVHDRGARHPRLPAQRDT